MQTLNTEPQNKHASEWYTETLKAETNLLWAMLYVIPMGVMFTAFCVLGWDFMAASVFAVWVACVLRKMRELATAANCHQLARQSPDHTF